LSAGGVDVEAVYLFAGVCKGTSEHNSTKIGASEGIMTTKDQKEHVAFRYRSQGS